MAKATEPQQSDGERSLSTSETDEEVTVRVENFTKKYGDTTAVNNVTFEVRDGEFFSLVGPSGCGKSTTLRTIAGFQQPTEGSIYLKGTDVTESAPSARDTAMVFQGYALFPHKTVGENVGFGLKMQGVPEEKREERVAEMLELVDLAGYEDRSPEALSGGQQQRVALARALILEPSVLLLDEPLSNLDLKLRKKMRVELKEIQNELGITTIYVTHDQEEALSMSDRVMVINNGEREQIAPPAEVYNTPENGFVADFIGDSNFLTGSIGSIDESTVDVELDSGEDVCVPKHRASLDSIEVGDLVRVTLRPEEINVSQAGNDPDQMQETIHGTVTARVFLGKSTQFHVDAGESGTVVAEMTGLISQRSLTEGDSVVLNWSPDNALIVE